MARIIHAKTEFHFDQVRLLMQEYRDAVVAIADRSGECACFDAFDVELVQLPGDYAPPRGCLLLGLGDTLVAGAVALRPIDETTGEVKRLYVRPAMRGQGIGRALLLTLIEQARQVGYSSLRLETLEAMHEAQTLYRALGFKETMRRRPPVNAHDQTISLQLDFSA